MNEKREQHNNNRNKIKILIVDSCPVARQELIQLVSQESNFVVCADVENTNQALGAIASQQVDLVIADTSLEGTTGTKLAEKIKSQCPNTPVLIIPTREFLNE